MSEADDIQSEANNGSSQSETHQSHTHYGDVWNQLLGFVSFPPHWSTGYDIAGVLLATLVNLRSLLRRIYSTGQ